jgi:hypothetical protein
LALGKRSGQIRRYRDVLVGQRVLGEPRLVLRSDRFGAAPLQAVTAAAAYLPPRLSSHSVTMRVADNTIRKAGETMEPFVGSGTHVYRVGEDWAHPPVGLEIRACAVSVDSQDRVYCFNRNAEHPVVVFDRNGNFLSSWGAGMSSRSRMRSASTPWITSG